ncbi:MAG: hypothetical protein H7843_10255 [Nitrospirota bacterium]
MALPFPLSVSYANRLEQCTSAEDLRSLALELSDYLEKNPKDIVVSMLLLIQCYMNLDDIENAEIVLDRCYKLVNGDVAFDLAMFKAEIESRKGNRRKSIEIIRQLLDNDALIEPERKIKALSLFAVYNYSMLYYDETHKVMKELWYIINHENEINYEDDNLFYSRISQYTDPLPLIEVMDNLKSCLHGRELLKDKTYSELYEYVKEYAKGNPVIEEIIPYEEVDIDFEAEKYFSLKIITKPLSIEDAFNLEAAIFQIVMSKYPGISVLVDVVGSRYD